MAAEFAFLDTRAASARECGRNGLHDRSALAIGSRQPSGDDMIRLRDKERGTDIGTITEEQLQFLIDQLEEESEEDHDYYINRSTLEAFEEQGIDPALLDTLKSAIGDREDMEIAWSRS
jgi:hypothetical protein